MIKRAIVTGATGMLASETINLLLNEGYEVVAVVRPGTTRMDNVPTSDKVIVAEVDNSEILSLPAALLASGIDEAELFFHFAWDGTHGGSRNDMDMQIRNIKSSVDAVKAASSLKCKVFLGAGSQAEYGRVPDGVKVSPMLPCNPENGYGIGKLCSCQMTRVEAQKLGMKHVWVRILSVYGPRDGAHTMVMSGIGTMLDGKKASYTKGEQMWDYIYSKDAARAFFLAATKGEDGAVYPIGSGVCRPLSDYIKAIRDAINPELPIGFGEVDYYPGQVMYLCADIDKLTKDTGFVPEYTFEQGIKETVEWYKEVYR